MKRNTQNFWRRLQLAGATGTIVPRSLESTRLAHLASICVCFGVSEEAARNNAKTVLDLRDTSSIAHLVTLMVGNNVFCYWELPKTTFGRIATIGNLMVSNSVLNHTSSSCYDAGLAAIIILAASDERLKREPDWISRHNRREDFQELAREFLAKQAEKRKEIRMRLLYLCNQALEHQRYSDLATWMDGYKPVISGKPGLIKITSNLKERLRSLDSGKFIQEIPRGLCPGVNHTCGSRC